MWSRNSIPRNISTEKHNSEIHMQPNIHCRVAYNSQEMDFLPLNWYHLCIRDCWYFFWQSWFQLVIHPFQYFIYLFLLLVLLLLLSFLLLLLLLLFLLFLWRFSRKYSLGTATIHVGMSMDTFLQVYHNSIQSYRIWP